LVKPQNYGRRVFWFEPQNRQLQFSDLSLKITATDSLFGPQNQAGDGLLVAAQNRREEDGTGHASKYSQARVSQFASKLANER
jgi:hypothetical protein